MEAVYHSETESMVNVCPTCGRVAIAGGTCQCGSAVPRMDDSISAAVRQVEPEPSRGRGGANVSDDNRYIASATETLMEGATGRWGTYFGFPLPADETVEKMKERIRRLHESEMNEITIGDERFLMVKLSEPT